MDQEQDRDRDQRRDDKSSLRESGSLQQMSDLEPKHPPLNHNQNTSLRNLELSILAWRNSLSSSSSRKFPIAPLSNKGFDASYSTNLPDESGMDRRFRFRSHFPIPSNNDTMAQMTNEPGCQQGSSLPPWNTRESNLGLEQTNQQHHYQSEAFAGVNVQMDGSSTMSSSSSLNFPTEPPSNQRNYTTNLPEEARRDGSYVLRQPIPIPIPSHNDTMAQQINERNPQESNLVLEQTDQLFDNLLEAFLGVNAHMDGSSSSSLNFPEESPSNPRNYTTNLIEEARRSYTASSMFSSPSHNEPGIGRPQGMVPPQPQPWNPQEYNLGLEQIDQQFDYQLEAFAAVNVQQMDGSSSSSLQFPTEPSPLPNQRYCGNYTTNFSEEGTENRPDTTFGYRHHVAAPTRTDISAASKGNLNFDHFSSQDIEQGGGSSSSQEPNPKRQKMKENAFNEEDLYLHTQSPVVSTMVYQSSASAQMDSGHEYPVPTRVPNILPPRPSLHRQPRGSGQTFPPPRPIINVENRTQFIPPESSQASPQVEGRSDGKGGDKKC